MPVRQKPRTLVRGDHVVTTRVPAEVTRLKAHGYREQDKPAKTAPDAGAKPNDSPKSDQKPETDKSEPKTSSK